jgi:WD40 repeat protein
VTPAQLNALRRRLYSRFPFIGGWIRRAAARRLAASGTLGAVRVLSQVATDTRDAKVQRIAVEFLLSRKRSDHIDALVQTWVNTRHPELERIMRLQGWVANKPPTAQVLSALKLEQVQLLIQGDAELVPALLEAADDKDVRIARLAAQVLRHLENPEAQAALCQWVIHNENAAARQAALDAGYLPSDVRQRALFYFITEQWGAYETVDFDQSMLRALHQAAGPALRQRILERLRRAGKVSYLTVLTGADEPAQLASLTAAEADFLIQTVAQEGQWDRVWSLALSLMPRHTARAVSWLTAADWQPGSEEERALLQALRESLPGEESLTAEALRQALPPAVKRAMARVPGRINDLAFHDSRPLLVVGTGQRKVVLWDYHRGERVSVLSGLEHSVGRVAVVGDLVLCAERGRGDDTCGIWMWENGEPIRLGEHVGPVTSLEPFGERLLTTGRDGRAVVWHLARRSLEREQLLHFWAREARLSHDGGRAVLLHNGITLLALPELHAIADVRGAGQRGVARSAAFGPAGEGVVVGRHNGQVVTIGHVEQAPSQVTSRLVHQHAGSVVGVEYLARRGLILSAGGDGSLRFSPWRQESAGMTLPNNQVRIDGAALTSLHLSPDGAFMAVGDAEANLWLWDLRVLDVPDYFSQPLAGAAPMHLATVSGLLESLSLPPDAEAALRFLERLLRFRFRRAIDIEDVSSIKVGEFDIEIE